jgi:Zn-dependent protease with chaperone function
MKKSIREIYRAFRGKLVGNKRMKHYICETLSLMDDNITNYVTSRCWFFGSYDDAWAYTLTGNDFKNQHLVILNEHLFMESKQQIHYTIAHEIGHIILRHRNSIMTKQTKKEIRQQEKEADIFAKKIVG